jgi:2-haloacid dehalogenase
MPPVKVATFDCYGTLVDWEGGAAAFLYDLARRNGDFAPGPGRVLRERWEEIQFEIIQQDYRPYHEVLRESLRAWVAERGYRWNTKEIESFDRSMQSWQPFPETIPALTRARKAGLRLVIISNTDRHIMEQTLNQLAPLSFDAVVVAEDVRSYKPDRRAFTRALESWGAPPGAIQHTASGVQ